MGSTDDRARRLGRLLIQEHQIRESFEHYVQHQGELFARKVLAGTHSGAGAEGRQDRLGLGDPILNRFGSSNAAGSRLADAIAKSMKELVGMDTPSNSIGAEAEVRGRTGTGGSRRRSSSTTPGRVAGSRFAISQSSGRESRW